MDSQRTGIVDNNFMYLVNIQHEELQLRLYIQQYFLGTRRKLPHGE